MKKGSDETRPPESPQTALDYIAPGDDEDQRRALIKARISGALISCSAVLLGVFLFIFSSIGGGSWQPFVAPSLLAVGVILMTLYQHFIRRRPGFLAGVLIGVGVAALIEGACFLRYG